MKPRITLCCLLSPVVLSSLLISAHFLRHGRFLFAGIGLTPLVALLFRHPLSVRITQGILLLATLEWGQTTYFLTSMRIAMGVPWEKLVLILGSVTVFTFASTFIFKAPLLRKFYKI